MQSNIHTFKDLDETFQVLNRKILHHPGDHVEFIRGSQGFVEDLMIKVEELKSTLDLAQIAYDPPTKWKMLVRDYIDPEEYLEFWDQLTKVTGTSFQFRFRKRKGPNGPCLIAMVFTRATSRVPWTRVKVFWRTAELQRKWGADLVLLSNMFDQVPTQVKDLIQIEQATLVLAQAFQSWRQVGPLLHLFVDDIEELDQEHTYTKRAIDSYHRVYNDPDAPKAKYAPVARMQAFHKARKNGEIEHTDSSKLNIWGALKGHTDIDAALDEYRAGLE